MTVILLLLSNLAIVNAFELKYYNIIECFQETITDVEAKYTTEVFFYKDIEVELTGVYLSKV